MELSRKNLILYSTLAFCLAFIGLPMYIYLPSFYHDNFSIKLETIKEKEEIGQNELRNATFQESSPATLMNDTFSDNYYKPSQDKEKEHYFAAEVNFSLKDQRFKEDPDQNLTEKETLTQMVKYIENRPSIDGESKVVTLQNQTNEEFKKELNILFNPSPKLIAK